MARRLPPRFTRPDLLWLLPTLVVAALAHRVGMMQSPQRTDDEGTYVAQAFAVDAWGELAHYTYWYDHPPLGWLQIAGWTWLTRGFERMDTAVLAGRELMLVLHLVSVVLLFVLVRRLLRSPVAATIAAGVFSLSPLAVFFHRQVYLDNIAVTWVLAALVCATARHHQLAAHIGTGLCAAIAVLTKETFALLLLPVAWEVWRCAHPETRRYTLTMAAGTLGVAGSAYLAFALLKGELLPGRGVSLVEALHFQLAGRSGSGSVFDPQSNANDTVLMWLDHDPVLLLLAVPLSVGALWVRTLRPYAVSYLLLVAMIFRGGYLPIPFVITALPIAAIVVGGVAVVAVRALLRRHVPLGLVATAGLVAAAVVVVIPPWSQGLQEATAADDDEPMVRAEHWIATRVPRDDKLLVDDALWVDLVREGFPREHVVWFYKPDTDPEVQEESGNEWRDYDWVTVTQTVRQAADEYPTVQDALESSRTVVAFGTGESQVEVRRIVERSAKEGGRP